MAAWAFSFGLGGQGRPNEDRLIVRVRGEAGQLAASGCCEMTRGNKQQGSLKTRFCEICLIKRTLEKKFIVRQITR